MIRFTKLEARGGVNLPTDQTTIDSPYLSPKQREVQFLQLAEKLNAQVVEYGQSANGRALRTARLQATQTKQHAVLCTANIHGLEYISSLVALGLMERLAKPDKLVCALRETTEIWVIACLNPDGYAHCFNTQGHGLLHELRHNSHGVDLNRNFPLPMSAKPSRLPGAGSNKPGSITYRGPRALSEPESKALDALLQHKNFHAAINLHSYMGKLLPARVKEKTHYDIYKQLCNRIRQNQPYRGYRRLANRWFDVFTGELEDHLHHHYDCWALCLESMTIGASFSQHLRAPSLFWRFNPRDPIPWIHNDVSGILAYFELTKQLQTPSKMK